MVPLPVLQPGQEAVGRHGLGDDIALHLVTAQVVQLFQVRKAFRALGHDPHPE